MQVLFKICFASKKLLSRYNNILHQSYNSNVNIMMYWHFLREQPHKEGYISNEIFPSQAVARLDF